MKKEEAKHIIEALKINNVQFAEGLSDSEIEKNQNIFNFTFPPDLKLFLQTGLPISGNFYDWRKAINDEKKADIIRGMFSCPLEGMIFDIKNNAFWLKAWGKKPENTNEQIEIATEHFKAFPKLIPIFSHRYIPETPSEEGNPVFSVYQMDIVYYGYDLASYLANEFKFLLPSFLERVERPKKIEFWTDWIENEDELIGK